MVEENVKIYSIEEIKRWKTVRLKKKMLIHPVPVRFVTLREEYVDDVFIVLDFKEPMNKPCLCGKPRGEHTPDCLVHPHLMVIVIDTADEEKTLEIRSLFLEPVEVEEEKTIPPPSPEKTSPGLTEGEPVDLTPVQEQEDVPAEIMKEVIPAKISFIIIDGNGLIGIQDAKNPEDEDFILVGIEWVWRKYSGEVGEMRLFGKDHTDGFVAVMEFDPGQLREFVQLLEAVLKNVHLESLIKKMRS
jgi:hypothetical protein